MRAAIDFSSQVQKSKVKYVQLKYVTMKNCVRIWPVIFEYTILLIKVYKNDSRGQRSRSNFTQISSILRFTITHISIKLHQFLISY